LVGVSLALLAPLPGSTPRWAVDVEGPTDSGTVHGHSRPPRRGRGQAPMPDLDQALLVGDPDQGRLVRSADPTVVPGCGVRSTRSSRFRPTLRSSVRGRMWPGSNGPLPHFPPWSDPSFAKTSYAAHRPTVDRKRRVPRSSEPDLKKVLGGPPRSGASTSSSTRSWGGGRPSHPVHGVAPPPGTVHQDVDAHARPNPRPSQLKASSWPTPRPPRGLFRRRRGAGRRWGFSSPRPCS